MKKIVLSTSIRLMLSLIFLISLSPVGLLPVQASAPEGTIAYVVPNQTDGDEIHLIEPDGSGDRHIYDTGSPIPENLSNILSLTWKPDASEIAFSGAQENTCSVYETDIYTIRPDGTNYRRVTEPPACGSREGIPTGTVTVPVLNGTNTMGPYLIYFEGAPAPQSVAIPPGGSMDVTFDNVADYGEQDQIAVFMGINGRFSYTGAYVDVEPGNAVRSGPLMILDGITDWGFYWPTYLPDGSTITSLFTEFNLYQFESNDQALGWNGNQLDFDLKNGAFYLAWGPTLETANKFLYFGVWTDSELKLRNAVFLGDVNAKEGQLLFDVNPLEDGSTILGLAWLPDGSGFLYSHKQFIYYGDDWMDGWYEAANIWEYSFATGQSTQLTNVPQGFTHQMSVSPDGSKIIYEYQSSGNWSDANPPIDLWVMNRDGSGQALFLENGRSPAWSPAPIPDLKPVPVMNSITPTSATAGGAAFTLTATGNSFVQGSVLHWNDADLATTFVNATTLTAQVPADKIAAAGTANVMVFNPAPGGGTSVSKIFTINGPVNNNPIPVATSLDPGVVDAGGSGFTLTVNGSDFVQATVVRWNGSNLPTVFVNATTLSAQVTADKIAQTGPKSVTVFNPAPGGGQSQSLTLSVVNPAPVLAGLNPNAATAGGPAFTLTVSGSKFINGSVVSWNGVDLATTYVNTTQLTAQVPADKIAAIGTASVAVYNPAPGGGTSEAKDFTINQTVLDNPTPVLTSFTPDSKNAGGTNFTLTVNGSSFVSASMVRWNGEDLVTAFVNATTLTVQVPAEKIRLGGAVSVTVYTPGPGGGVSAALVFTVNQPSHTVFLPLLLR